MKKWGPAVAVILGNIIFALWHYPYWKMGFLAGSLMIFLTFSAGVMISLNYLKTRNTLSTAMCHIFVDSPSALKILLGR
jgi:membrane protease YdiL (CAAX protease family)